MNYIVQQVLHNIIIVPTMFFRLYFLVYYVYYCFLLARDLQQKE